MKKTAVLLAAALIAMPLLITACGTPPENADNALTVLSPQGAVEKGKDPAPRLETLEGKKIAFWLSATPDQLYAGKGAELYDLLEKMLQEKFSGIEIVHYADLPMKFTPETEVVDAIAATDPDGVVVGFGG
ncbi:MAG: hypothetical protein JW793_03585 [Acidobacteria bacterium]|nr:hypothetical protein [Acidobacteriota bacterium]